MSPLRLLPVLLLSLLLLLPSAARADDYRELAEFKARAGGISAVAISADGRYVLTGEDDGLVTLWDVAKNAVAREFNGHDRTVLSAALLSDGKRAVTGGDDDKLIVWDLATGHRLLDLATGYSTPVTLTCSPDDRFAATGDPAGTIKVWDLATGHTLHILARPSAIRGLQFSPDGATLAAGYASGEIILWDTTDWKPRLTLSPHVPSGVGALAFSPDSSLLLTGDQDGVVRSWLTADGTPRATMDEAIAPDATPTPPAAPVFPGGIISPADHGAAIYICLGPGAARAFVAYQNTIPKLWDTKSGKLIDQYVDLFPFRFYAPRYGFPYAAAAVSRARTRLVTMKENLAQVWQIDFLAPSRK